MHGLSRINFQKFVSRQTKIGKRSFSHAKTGKQNKKSLTKSFYFPPDLS